MSRKLILVSVAILMIASLAASQGETQDLSAAAKQGYVSGSFIVEFDSDPVVKARADTSISGKQYRAGIRDQHRQFREAIGSRGIRAEIGESYSQSFNGMTLSGVSEGERQKLENMPMVEEVHRNYIYRTKLDESVPQVGAPEVWDRKVDGVNNTGHGITIAVIDTGVDYTHPDLGNCTETEFSNGNCGKVIGGYDFVNDDSDPMDTKGHGTHVAATAAGNGSIDGVAPAADIRGYKVLDSDGLGTTSDIIAGIDRAALKGSDVISLSLGGPGHPDDAMSDAVNNAVLNGSVVTVAAGNDENFYTIGSPGTARRAITVGSVDGMDQLSGFSSKGPVVWNNGDDLITKPDIMAPGENICAARWNDSYSGYECRNGDHVSLRGTSMATPHVAGAAALLVQSHPSWEPGQVKSALMGSAKDLGLIPFEQGTGRLNVSRAVKKDVVTRKQSINYGNITGQTGASRKIVVENIGDETESVDVSKMKFLEFNGSDTQDSISVNTTSLILGAGEKETLKVSTGAIGLDGIYYSYLNLTTNTTGYDHRVPVSVARTAPASPQIASSYPDKRIYTDDQILNISLEIEPYDGRTTANVTINSTVSTLWRNSSQLSGWTTKDLSEGLSEITFEVYEAGDESAKTNLSASAILDTKSPDIVSGGPNKSIVEPSSFLVSLDAADDTELYGAEFEVNSSGSYDRLNPELDRSVKTCDSQWGANCSRDPEYEINNTINQCKTGSGTFESIENIYLNTTELFPGQTVNVTAEYDVFSSNNVLYIYHFNGYRWKELFAGNREGGIHNVSRTVELNETGDHTFRAMISYGPTDGHCASGTYFDNDDLNATVAPRGIYVDGSSDAGSENFSVENPEKRVAEWRLNLTDRAGNFDVMTGKLEFNRPPEVVNYTLFNSTGHETSVFDQNESIYFNVTVRDNNSNINDGYLDRKGPERNERLGLETEGIGSWEQINGSVGAPGSPGKVSLNFTFTDSKGDIGFKNRNATIKDYVAPDIESVNSTHREVLSWEENTLSIAVNDSRGLGEVKLASNRSGSWSNLTGYSEELNGTEGNASFSLPVNDTVYWRFWVSDRFGNWNSTDTRSFEEVNFSVSFPERAELEEGINITMERPFWYTVNRSDLNWSYTGRAEQLEGDSDVYGLANFTVHNPGNYTVEVFANDTEGKVNTTNTTIKANVTDPATDTAFFSGTPVYGFRGESYTSRLVFNAKVYNGSQVKISNSTWNESLNTVEDIDQVENSLTGEPYNYTYCEPPGCIYAWPSVEFNYSVNEAGRYDLEAVLNRSADQLTETDTVSFYSKTDVTADINIKDGRRRRLVLKGEAWRDINTTYYYPENDTLNLEPVPDLPELDERYSVELLVYSPETGEYGQRYGMGVEYRGTDIEGSFNIDTRISNETVEKEDKKLYRRYMIKPGFNYEKANIAAGYQYDMIDNSTENITIYQCSSYTSGGCEAGWTESDIQNRRMEENSFEIEASANETEAVALGEPYQPEPEQDEEDGSSDDSSGGSSGGGGFSGGGFAPPADQEEEEQPENMVTVAPGEPATVQVDNASIDEITLSSEEEVQSEVTARKVEDTDLEIPDEVEETHSFVNITSTETDLDANITFSLNETEFDGKPGQVRMYRYSEGWQKLPTKFESSTGSTYRFTASTPGFSIFMIGTEKASCPAFQARKVDGDLCRTFERCETPEGWERVDSCVENTDTGDKSGQEQQENRQGPGLLLMAIPAAVTVLLLSGGALLWRRRKNRREIEKNFEEVTDAVKEQLRSNSDLPENRIQTLMVRAGTALKNNDYDRMEDIMEELVDILREN